MLPAGLHHEGSTGRNRQLQRADRAFAQGVLTCLECDQLTEQPVVVVGLLRVEPLQPAFQGLYATGNPKLLQPREYGGGVPVRSSVS